MKAINRLLADLGNNQKAALKAVLNLPELEAQAAALGDAAFHNGIKAAPALDRKLFQLYESTATRLGSPASLAMMDAWSRAWHAANLAAPVPGVTDQPEWNNR